MAEAALVMNSWTFQNLTRTTRVRLHWIFQLGGLIFVLLGLLIIVIYKVSKGKRHLHSWHAILSATSIGLLIVTNLSGLLAKYSVKFRQTVSPAKLKMFHIFAGIFAFIMAIVAVITGFYTGYYTEANKIVTVVNRHYCTAVTVILSVVVLANPLVEIISRLFPY